MIGYIQHAIAHATATTTRVRRESTLIERSLRYALNKGAAPEDCNELRESLRKARARLVKAKRAARRQRHALAAQIAWHA